MSSGTEAYNTVKFKVLQKFYHQVVFSLWNVLNICDCYSEAEVQNICDICNGI